jgi:hypothetical protein
MTIVEITGGMLRVSRRQRPRQSQGGALHAATWKTAAISNVALHFAEF